MQQEKTPAERFTFFIIPKAEKVSHASLVLEKPIFAIDAGKDGEPLEAANPKFGDMMAAVTAFQK